MSKNKRSFIITELLLGVLLVIGIGFIAYNKLNEKPERIHISWAVYVLVVMANLVIIVACVLWKSWRIANENPVNSIKSE